MIRRGNENEKYIYIHLVWKMRNARRVVEIVNTSLQRDALKIFRKFALYPWCHAVNHRRGCRRKSRKYFVIGHVIWNK